MLRSDIPVDLPIHLFIDYDDALGVDCDQTPADVGYFQITDKCEVVRALLTVTETCVGATTTPVVKFDKRPTAGSDVSRGDGDIANFVMSTTAAGKQLYDKVALGAVLYPGDQVMVQLATKAAGGAAGHFVPALTVKKIPEVQANLTDTVETA